MFPVLPAARSFAAAPLWRIWWCWSPVRDHKPETHTGRFSTPTWSDGWVRISSVNYQVLDPQKSVWWEDTCRSAGWNPSAVEFLVLAVESVPVFILSRILPLLSADWLLPSGVFVFIPFPSPLIHLSFSRLCLWSPEGAFEARPHQSVETAPPSLPSWKPCGLRWGRTFDTWHRRDHREIKTHLETWDR